MAARSGHNVIRVLSPGTDGHNDAHPRIREVIADLPSLGFLPDGCADGVVAEARTLSLTLAAESLVAEISRVLRPSGRVLACVDSLVFGMAVLAEQQHWPELADLPHAEVVLVPWPDGTITRCYGTEQLRELFADNGLDISWIRPRTVLAAKTVSYLLHNKRTSLERLVDAELHAEPDDSVGTQLVISARKPLPAPPVALALAGDASLRLGPRLEPALGNGLPAVHAAAVRPLLDPAQRREYRHPLVLDRLEHRPIPVRLRQVQPRVRRVRGRTAPVRRVFTPQHRYRPVQVVANFLKSLTGSTQVHGESRLLRSVQGRSSLASGSNGLDELGPVVPHGIDGR